MRRGHPGIRVQQWSVHRRLPLDSAAMRRLWGCAVFVALALAACTNHKKKMEDRVEKREKAKDAFEKKEDEKKKAAIPKIEPAHLEPFWDDATYLKVTSGRPCPDGVWTLFSTSPGEDAEKAENEKKRPE